MHQNPGNGPLLFLWYGPVWNTKPEGSRQGVESRNAVIFTLLSKAFNDELPCFVVLT